MCLLFKFLDIRKVTVEIAGVLVCVFVVEISGGQESVC